MKNNIKILIVEDNALTATSIESELRKMGYKKIDMESSYHLAMKKIKNKAPDLILLDISLKGKKTGIDIAYEKEVFNKIPIIYISGLEYSEIEEEMLPTKLKNYFMKPIKHGELKVAIHSLFIDKIWIVDIGHDFSYNLEDKTLFQKKKFVHLGKNEKLLLERLIAQKGEIVLTAILEETIWGSEVKARSSLRTLVGNLRKKLKPEMIVNDVGFGYKLPIPKE